MPSYSTHLGTKHHPFVTPGLYFMFISDQEVRNTMDHVDDMPQMTDGCAGKGKSGVIWIMSMCLCGWHRLVKHTKV